MSRALERAAWVNLGDRLHEIDPEEFDEVLDIVRDLVEAGEVLGPRRTRYQAFGATAAGGDA